MIYPHITNYDSSHGQNLEIKDWTHCKFQEGEVLVTKPGEPDELILIDELLDRLKMMRYDQWYIDGTLAKFQEHNEQWLQND